MNLKMENRTLLNSANLKETHHSLTCIKSEVGKELETVDRHETVGMEASGQGQHVILADVRGVYDNMTESDVFNRTQHTEADIPVSAEVVIECITVDTAGIEQELLGKAEHSVLGLSGNDGSVTDETEPKFSNKPDSFGVGYKNMFNFPPTPEQSPQQNDLPYLKHTSTDKQEIGTSHLAIKLQSCKEEHVSGNIEVSQPCLVVPDQVFINLNVLNETTEGSKVKTKPKPAAKTLKFPPCLVCSGKASGLHYGVNSCEACKGFFRRYLLRNEEYKCSKGGNCEIINRNRGNCSGCRLKKCLEIGMAKERSQLGRYTLARRTETIKEVNKLEGKVDTDCAKGSNKNAEPTVDNMEPSQLPSLDHLPKENDFDPDKEMISRKLQCQEEIDSNSVSFTDALVENLVRAMDEIKPYGLAITTDQELQDALKSHYDKYIQKIKMYGQMKSVPKEEFKRLYKDFGIDVDGRMNTLRESAKEVEGMIERYCLFAKHIPDFQKLSYRDQSNLLKASRCDFFMILMSEGYSEKFQVFISHSGCAYHVEEAADKFFSRKLITTVCDMYRRWQLLHLSKAEKALLIALTLVFTDRCNLDNHELVESIQISLVELLRKQLQRTCKLSAQRRFAKIIGYLILMRESSEMYLKEYKDLCDDEMVIEEVPMLTEFLLEDW